MGPKKLPRIKGKPIGSCVASQNDDAITNQMILPPPAMSALPPSFLILLLPLVTFSQARAALVCCSAQTPKSGRLPTPHQQQTWT